MMKVQGIILDWAGTAVDYGCMAPVQVFFEIFRELGIEPTMEEVRAPMGCSKWDHIKHMLEVPRIGKQFQDTKGRPFDDNDVDKLHDAFEPKLLDILHGFAAPIDYVVETVQLLRQAGLSIGATTGYNDTMMQIITSKAKENGYAPDYWLTPDSVKGKGRPFPYMIYANMIELDMGMPSGVVKIGDTESDMLEGRNAGVWAVGVVKGSSMLGLTQEEVNAMAPDALKEQMEAAKQRFLACGAHYTIDDMSELPNVIEAINIRLQEGDGPNGHSSISENRG